MMMILLELHCKFVYEIWSHLVVTHEGTSQVKWAKIDLLRSQYENFSTLKELSDKEEIELIGLISNLKTHEMERKTREEKASWKKKILAFKSTPIISDEDEE